MDLHILVVISCVFFASFGSLLFINKFLRRKTFEEVIAEKKAMTEKLYANNKSAAKKPKKVLTKKELKREKKQRQKEQQRDTTEQEDSDNHSEQTSMDEEPRGLSKTHVEFEPDPEILTFNSTDNPRRASSADKDAAGMAPGTSKSKGKKDKKNVKAGILVNKNESVAIKESGAVEEILNNFEAKPPKDVVELKKLEKEEKQHQQSAHPHVGGKKDKNAKSKNSNEKVTAAAVTAPATATADSSTSIGVEQSIELPVVAKEVKQQEEKIRHGSPKNQPGNAKPKQPTKKQIKESAATRELVHAMDKLSDTDTIGVSLLMNLFRRAELNRSEIQILIDYLLNKQQDMPVNHSEWSDDICQKLKRQLEEKERALHEEQEASIGIQTKLRELRAEINLERAQMHANVKAYVEKLQSKDQEIVGLNQEIQSMNDKFTIERQKFQAKLLQEKQSGSQDLLAKLQMMQEEMAHKDQCIADLQRIVNASRQSVEETQQCNEIIQQQAQQIRALEQQRDELEQQTNNQIFELEKVKTLEAENADYKVELRNMQNDLDSARAEIDQLRNVELNDKQNLIQAFQANNEELTKNFNVIVGQVEEQRKEQSKLDSLLDVMRTKIADKDHQLADLSAKNAELLQQLAENKANVHENTANQHELRQLVEKLQAEIAGKHKQLQDVALTSEKFASRERELMQQLQEQKDKNNELRMKNWKLVEALQNAEATTLKQNNKTLTSANANLVLQEKQLIATTQKSTNAAAETAKSETQLRELFQRLYPDAVKACASTALSLPFDQWIEQILSLHIKESVNNIVNSNANSNSNTNSNAISCSNKSTQSMRTSVNSVSSNTNHSSAYNNNSHATNNNNNVANNNELTNNSNNDSIRISDTNSNSNTDSNSNSDAEIQKLHSQNAQLRVQIDELTKLVTKTSNTLSELEGRAREQEENWRSIVREKDELITSLQHSNGQQDI